MHRKLMISYQCYKLLPFGRHINQLPQKCLIKSPLVAQGRCLSSSQSSESDGGSGTHPATAAPTVAAPSQSEVKTAKESAKEEELKEGKKGNREDVTVAAEVEPQLQAPAPEQVEPQLQAPAPEQVEPQLQTAAVREQVEPQLQTAAVREQVEPQLQAAVVGEQVEPQLQAPAPEQVEPQLQTAAVREQVEPQLQAAVVGEQVEAQVQAPAPEQVEPQLQTAAVGEKVEPQLQAAAVGEQVEPQLQASAVREQVEPQLQEAVARERHVGDVRVTAEVETQVAATQVAVETVNTTVTPQAERAESEQDPAREGKKSLLELLGAMKVDVTTKRKVRTPRPLQSEQLIRSKAKPAMAATRETTKGMFQEASTAAAVEENQEGAGLAPELVAAATAAASTLPNRGQATSELLRQLRRHESQAHNHQRGGESISNIIADMKVGRRANGRLDARPANQIRFDEDGRGYTHDRGITSELDGVRRRKSGFSGKRLNVFTTKLDDSPGPNAGLWDLDLANRIAMATNQLPRNGFEEMLLWTNQGKLWQYPINNEAGLEEERSVPFHEHVFLERHLSKGFPSHGPVRHFMELVVTGLAKNPYLTANQKQEHITWFRDYFQEKRGVLEEAEVYGS